ncbi:MAG TPA: hypothetical protein VGQ57_20655, partial [Polyangiaceae bacterium]|nr:hypothetical protein [Polyangiaceae bacterium]
MRMRHATAFGAFAFVLASPSTGKTNVLADILGFPVKMLLGSTLDKAQGNVDAAVGKALDTADIKLRDHEGRISDLATALVDRSNHALEERIVQIKTSANGVVDNALSQVDGLGTKLIDQVGDEANGVIDHLGDKANGIIDNLDDKVRTDLAKVDEIVRTRSDDIDKMLEDRVTQVNHAVEERIAQADEVARGRLGDVNAIASEQRLALEAMILRVAVAIGGVVFLVFVLRGLWQRYTELSEAGVAERGARRTVVFARRLLPALVGPSLAAF